VKFKKNSISIMLILLTIFVLSKINPSHGSEITQNFLDAFINKDTVKMSSIIKENKDKIPDEIKALIDEAKLPELSKEDKETKLNIAEIIANAYKNVTGNIEPLKQVKKDAFDSKLSPQLHSAPVEGFHIIEMPKPSGDDKNIFKPDNITIKRGESVRWVNTGETEHILASMPLISVPGLFSPKVEAGQSWDYKFEKTGEYYYLCFIHKSMIGKVTVEE